MIEWNDCDFHPVVDLPDEYTILDLSKGVWAPSRTEFSIGKYNEARPNMYNSDIFAGVRNIHMGIDIGGPIGTPCMAFMDGEISHFGYNPESGDYGYVVITRHYISGKTVWALYGHLDADSIEGRYAGQILNAGDIIGRLGAHHENGGWEPHLHLQLSQIEPETHDLPGVVAPENQTQALLDYPDPRLVLGPIY